MAFLGGTQLGPYQILSALGRAVALKLLTRTLTILNGSHNSVAKPNFSPP